MENFARGGEGEGEGGRERKGGGEGKQVHKVATEISPRRVRGGRGRGEESRLGDSRLKNNKRGGKLAFRKDSCAIGTLLGRTFAGDVFTDWMSELPYPEGEGREGGGGLKRWLARWRKEGRGRDGRRGCGINCRGKTSSRGVVFL